MARLLVLALALGGSSAFLFPQRTHVRVGPLFADEEHCPFFPGAVVHAVTLPFASGPFVGVGTDLAFDAGAGELIVVGHDSITSGAHHVLAFDPTTEKLRSVVRIEP